MPVLENEGESELLDDLANELFEARNNLIEVANQRGYEGLFLDEESMADMEAKILSVGDEEDRKELQRQFALVEHCYREYNAELAKLLNQQNKPENE